MYQTHFGLRQRPFRPSPDLAAYYPAGGHEAALARLRQGLADDEGLLLLTGAPGLGKTLLCHVLLERLGDETTTALVTNGRVCGRAGLLQTLLYDLSLPHEGRAEQELRLALTDHLLQTYAAGRRTLLVVDEAQHLTPDLLEELRLLGNLDGPRGPALQVLFAALPSFLDLLQLPGLAALGQRLAVRARLGPLAVQEAADYLAHQLRLAGGRPERVLSDEALEVLARGTGGAPRLLNQAANQALLLAHAAGLAQVDAEVALEALALLGLGAPPDAESGPDGAAGEVGEEGYPLLASPRRPA
jgi:type II secretory pathway predicted ATPase ExeA